MNTANILIPMSSYPMPSDPSGQITVRTEEKAEASQSLAALSAAPDSPQKQEAEQALQEKIDDANAGIRRETVKKRQEDGRAQRQRLAQGREKADEEKRALAAQDASRLDTRA